MKRSRMVRSAVAVTALTLGAAGGAYALNGRTTAPAAASPRLGLAAYHSFSGCDDLLSYLRTQALPLVGAFGLETSTVPGGPVGLRELAPGAVAAHGTVSGTAAEAAGQPGATSDTGTNIQVAGVDEADVTKKSGDLVLTVGSGAHTGLTVLQAGDRQVRVVGRLATDWHPEQLLVQGTTVLLLGTVPEDRRPGPIPAPPPNGGTPRLLPVPSEHPRARVAQVDVADPTHPRLVRTLDLDGALVGARLAGGVVRLAAAAAPSRLPFVQPQSYTAPNDPQADAGVRAALEANRKVVQTAPVSDWLPQWTLSPATGRATSGTLLDCSQVGVPAEFSGLGTLAMLTFDLRSGGVDRWQGAGVVATGTTLYSTGDHTYVATRPWALRVVHPEVAANGPARPDLAVRVRPQRTLIHAFETTAGGVRYLGSGSVDGTLLGQYAMDEYQGMLRVASTVQPDAVPGPQVAPGAVSGAEGSGGSASVAPPEPATTVLPPQPRTTVLPPNPRPTVLPPQPRTTVLPPNPRPTVVPPVPVPPSSGSVTVLRLAAGGLEQVGRLDGLGKDESVQGVRFAGPLAYVVTFRRTDPLFVVDLADPAHPRVAGSVGLLGYSAYLHPLGNGLLLGIGQDATADGGRTGLLMSLFDVSDPASPRLLDRVTLPDAWAQVESDVHAFTYAGGLALVPLEPAFTPSTQGNGLAQDDGAVVAVRVEGRGLGAPAVLHLQGAKGVVDVDPVSLRTFADGGSIVSIAPGDPQGVATVHDAASLQQVAAATF